MPKFLHINHFGYPDYQNDMVFHGGRSLYGTDYVESHRANYMYKSYAPNKSSLYGRGFTLYCRLDDVVPDNSDLEAKIADRYFDYIVYGSVFRCRDYWDLVTKVYPRDRIILIDGEDHTGIFWDMAAKGTYFKRELINTDLHIHPIGFGIPKELISHGTKKTKEFAYIDPNDRKTYIYDNEESYYQDYRESYFAWTQKKAGWDCLRHYEILMNGCFPAMRNIHQMPFRTMTAFPLFIVRDYFDKHGYKFTSEYWEYWDKLMEHTIRCNTTEAVFGQMMWRLNQKLFTNCKILRQT